MTFTYRGTRIIITADLSSQCKPELSSERFSVEGKEKTSTEVESYI